jgi:hypothetical protein
VLDGVHRAGDAFSVAESRAGPAHVVRVEGPVDMLGTLVLGRRLLATLNDGARQLLLDLSAAQPLAASALLGTVLRIERYAERRDARLVVLAGEATKPMFALAGGHGHVTIVSTRAEAEAQLGHR